MRFPVNFVKFLRTPFLKNTSGQLLLNRVVINTTFVYHILNPGLDVQIFFEKERRTGYGSFYFEIED